MAFPDPTVAAGWGVAIVAFCAAGFERFKSSRVEKKVSSDLELLSDAKMFQDRSEMLRRLAEDNLKLYQAEHEDHQKTRDFWHDKSSEFQTTLGACQEKLNEFQARPDYSDVMKFIAQQAETSLKILDGINSILKVIQDKVRVT